jgi:hypothetical protein
VLFIVADMPILIYVQWISVASFYKVRLNVLYKYFLNYFTSLKLFVSVS